MSNFKEAGQFSPIEVDEEYIANGGVEFTPNGNAERSYRNPNFRLRSLDQLDTRDVISANDIDSINLRPGNPRPKTVPKEPSMLGLEAEFFVIDNEGNLVDLYGGGFIYVNGKGPEVATLGDKWLFDELDASPEGLRWQVEIGTKPANNWGSLEINTLNSLKGPYTTCLAHNIYLQPTGLSGEELENTWGNIPPHPYLISIHSHGLSESALRFDSNTVQAHNDLRPYGATIDFGLYVGNVYNNTLASMYNAITTSAPFTDGYITNNYSNREQKRNRLSTQGGVQNNMPIDGELFLQTGDALLRQGKIPVPERAFGSHCDTRAAKLTTGTFETGPADMIPNIDFWIAQPVVNRQFLKKVAEHLITGEPLPPFMEKTNFETRKANRENTGKYGPHAHIKISNGEMTIKEAWYAFFDWAEPNDPEDKDWTNAKQTILNMLDTPAQILHAGDKALEKYFARGTNTYMRGNVSEIMRVYANSIPGTDVEKIAATNSEMSKYFTRDIGRRLKEKQLI